MPPAGFEEVLYHKDNPLRSNKGQIRHKVDVSQGEDFVDVSKGYSFKNVEMKEHRRLSEESTKLELNQL